jgi:DUF4097 and DUF4098 domain-containing protein YvlB
MAGYPPPYPPPGYDPREQRRFLRDQARAQRAAYRAQRDAMRYQMRGMRRSSVLAPILLVAIGVVVLLIESGRIDRGWFWAWYGHWWPLLLVIAGLVVLGEWVVDQQVLRDPQQPRYRRSLGGGVFVLMLFFVISGVIASAAHDFPSGYSTMFPGTHFGPDTLDEIFGDKHESDQTVDLAFNPGTSLTVVNPRGDVTISGTSDDNRIHIAVHKQVYASSDSEADSKADRLAPSTTTSGSSLAVTLPGIDGARADLVIQVPTAAPLTVNANRGDVHIASIKASVGVTANRGDIELSAISGPVTAHINSMGSSISAHSLDGGITLQGRAEDVTFADVAGPVSISGEYFGTTLLQHINGSVHFHTSRTDFQLARLDGQVEISPDSNLSADQVLGPVVLTTRERNITLDRVAGDIAVTNRNGAIDLTAAPTLGNITIEDRTGNVKLIVPEKAGYSLQAGTTNGNIESDLPLSASNSDHEKSLSGTVGAGGPTVRITTTNGDISIDKADVQPLPPTAPAPPKITLAPSTPTPPAPKAAPKQAAAPKPPAAPKTPDQ